MALRLFSRCEGTTLDGTHDYSAGDTTWTLVSGAEFSASGVKVGTNGLHAPSGDDYAQLDAASIVDRTVGTVAFWLRINTTGSGSWILNLQGTAAADRITIEDGGGDLILRHRVNGGNNVALSTSAAGLTTSTWYFVQAHWSAANDDLRLEVYDSTGTLIQAVENLSASLGGSPADIVSIQAGTQQASGRFSIDNIFVGDSYSDDFLAHRNITSYTDLSGPAVTITDAGDETFYNGEVITITGSGFGESQGLVYISPADDVEDAGIEQQSVVNWGDTSIQIQTVLGDLTPGNTLYLFVVNGDTVSNATGYQVSFSAPVAVSTLNRSFGVRGSMRTLVTM